MAEKQLLTKDEQLKRFAETAWLNYFNQVLYSKKIISERDRNRMANMIAARKPTATLSKNLDLQS